jgi:hypothetical protein
MKMKFTASVRLAMNYVLKLHSGTFWVLLEGAGEPQKIERPVWANFVFFGRIEASPIQSSSNGSERGEDSVFPGYSLDLKRTVDFFHQGIKVASVNLIGRKYNFTEDGKGFEEGLEGGSFWAVSSIGFLRCCCPGITSASGSGSESWEEINIEARTYAFSE